MAEGPAPPEQKEFHFFHLWSSPFLDRKKPARKLKVNEEKHELERIVQLSSRCIRFRSARATTLEICNGASKADILHFSGHGHKYSSVDFKFKGNNSKENSKETEKRLKEYEGKFKDLKSKICEEFGEECYDDVLAKNALLETSGDVDKSIMWFNETLKHLENNDKIAFEYYEPGGANAGDSLLMSSLDIQSLELKPFLVSVLACHGESIGNAFLNIGVPHVVTIKRYSL
jgi:hypothetical protein